MFALALVLSAFINLYSQQRKEVRTYYDYGHTVIKERYYIDVATNRKDGSYKLYNQYGVVREEGNYYQGNQFGKWISRQDNGDFYSFVTYDNKGIMNGPAEGALTGRGHDYGKYVNDRMEGLWKTYLKDENNKDAIYCEINYKKGEMDGVCKQYQTNRNGTLRSIGTMRATGLSYPRSVKEGKMDILCKKQCESARSS